MPLSGVLVVLDAGPAKGRRSISGEGRRGRRGLAMPRGRVVRAGGVDDAKTGRRRGRIRDRPRPGHGSGRRLGDRAFSGAGARRRRITVRRPRSVGVAGRPRSRVRMAPGGVAFRGVGLVTPGFALVPGVVRARNREEIRRQGRQHDEGHQGARPAETRSCTPSHHHQTAPGQAGGSDARPSPGSITPLVRMQARASCRTRSKS